MLNELAVKINTHIPEARATALMATVGDSSVSVAPSSIFKVCEFLKNSGFNVLQVISAVDYPPAQEKEGGDAESSVKNLGEIEINYILADFVDNRELILKTRPARGEKDQLVEIDSVCGVWKSADWQERECYDMLGIKFKGHPNMQRILCPDDWQGYPLRKDYIVAEKYRHMTINPPEKMNLPEREFFGLQKAADKAKKEAAAAASSGEI